MGADDDLAWHESASAEVAADRVGAAFGDLAGGRPDGTWAAPGRVNVIGEHVDYNAGRCLPIALPHRTFSAVRRRRDGALRVASAQGHPPWSGPVAELDGSGVTGWARYVAGAVWALRRAGADVPGLDVVIDSDVPMGAGLSSSAALICSVAAAGAELSAWGDVGDPATRATIAAAGVAAETEFVGAPTGGMDQAVAMRAAAGHALLLDCRDDTVAQLAFDLDAAGLALLVIDTRVAHRNVDGRYEERRRGCARATRLLGVATLREVADATAGTPLDDALRPLAGDEAFRLARHVVSEMHRVDAVVDELLAGRVDRIGPLLDGSHRSLRDDFAVSCAQLDLAVDAAREAGALGARMTGGGFGGSAIALVPSAAATDVATSVDRSFVDAGFGRPAFLWATPSGPAGRVR
jgi:galactokinase